MTQMTVKSKSREFTLHHLFEEKSMNNETVQVKSFFLELRVHGENETQKIVQNVLFSIF